jgi:hypothetical protein
MLACAWSGYDLLDGEAARVGLAVVPGQERLNAACAWFCQAGLAAVAASCAAAATLGATA